MGKILNDALYIAQRNVELKFGGDLIKEVKSIIDDIKHNAYLDEVEDKKRCITLCGSTRFYNDFKEANLKLTLNDWLVYSIGIDTKSDADIKTAGDFKIDHERLDRLHKRKIDRSEAIMVIDINGYVGQSTRSEIEYAREHHKDIYSYTKTIDFANPVKFVEQAIQ